MHLNDLCAEFLRTNLRIRKEATRTHYYRSIAQFGEFLGHAPTISDLTNDNVAAWMNATIDAELAEATANQRAKQIKALWTWAAKRRYVEQFPTVTNVAEPEGLPSAWSMEELEALLAACAKAPGWCEGHRWSTWITTLHDFILDSAERTGATFALRREWVDLRSRVVVIPAVVRKGSRKTGHYPIRQKTADGFRAMFQVSTDTGLVWDRPWSDLSTFYARYRNIVTSAGLPWVPRKTGLKKLRITVATMIAAKHGSALAADKLMHSSTSTTTNSYIDRVMAVAHDRGVWPPPEDGLPFPQRTKRPWWRLIG